MAITIDGVVYRNLEDQVQYLTDIYEDLYNISTYMPSDVSTQNKLATRAYVDQSVTTVSAHYLTSDAEGNNFATKASLLSGPYYYGSEEHDPDENDYAFVNADESHSDLPSRYVFIGDEWKYQYSLSAASGVVDLTSVQTITGVKTFSNGIKVNNNTSFGSNNAGASFKWNDVSYLDVRYDGIYPTSYYSDMNLGGPNNKWKDLYLSGAINIGTINKIEIDGNNGFNFKVNNNTKLLVRENATYVNNDLFALTDGTRNIGTVGGAFKDLYLKGEIVGSYQEANTVTYSSGNYVASFTSIDSTTVNKIKYIEVTLEGTDNCVSFNVPVAAINMSQYSVNYEIKTNGYPVESIFILYMSNTLSIAVPHTDSTYTAHIFIKFH